MNKIKIRYCIGLFFLIANFNILADEKFNVKCYVSLIDGNQTIYFARLPKQSLKQVANNLQGKKIHTIISNNETVVYKVNECTLEEKQFTDSTARYIESKLEM